MNSERYVNLPRSFYNRANVVEVARDLIGKILVTNINGELTGGEIVETEAYCGRGDKACHAYERRTKRTEIMYSEGGKAYIYLCYGVHHLFNVVTNKDGFADAVLIRSLKPVFGLDTMIKRRNGPKNNKLTSGPGTLSQAMGLNKSMNGEDLVTSDQIWIADDVSKMKGEEIETDVRIGIDYAEEDALLPWRFYVKGSPYVSRQKKSRS